MKKSILCSIVALACGLGLSACGGNDDGELQLYAGLGGVTKEGLTISNKGSAPIKVAPGPTFIFPDLVPIDSNYDITVVTEPPNVEVKSCVVNNGKGNTGAFSPQNISIVCIIKTYNLGGEVKGLTAEGLVVNNGAQSVKIAKDATAFSMTTPSATNAKIGQVAEGVPYGLTILTQPTGLKCTIANPNGTMPAGPVGNIVITCTP